MQTPLVRVGVLSHHRGKGCHAICRAVNRFGHAATQFNYDDVVFETRQNTLTVDLDVDVVLNWKKLARTRHSMDRIGVLQLLNEILPVINPVEATFKTDNKPVGLTHLAEETSIRIPDIVYSKNHSELSSKANELPNVVHKPAMGGGGSEITKLDVDQNTAPLLSGPHSGLLQHVIETGDGPHTDVRAFVVDDEVVAAMERTATDGNWKTNISSGGDGAKIDLPAEAEDIAVTATDELGVAISGVDLIQDTDGDWYLIELNTPAGFSGLHNATGVNVAAHIAAHAIERGGGTVPQEDVERVARSLDMDSSPYPNSGRFHALQSGESYEIAGMRKTVTGMFEKRDDFTSHLALDQELASECGTVGITDVTETPVPGRQTERPVASVQIRGGGDLYWQKVVLCDLSDYDADIISRTSSAVKAEIEPEVVRELLHSEVESSNTPNSY